MARFQTPAFALSLVLGATALFPARAALAQDGGLPDAELGSCPLGATGCASAPISYSNTRGIPIAFDIDTGWVPASSPVQVRFRSALEAHTTVRATGTLESSWPSPMRLRAPGSPGTGFLEIDYGIVLDARVRLHLEVSGRTYDWEGRVPYVPSVDFRAAASTHFDPWAWDGVRVRGSTARQRIADVPLTDAFISIPGIVGGLSFAAAADLSALYRSTRISFGSDADPITARTEFVMGAFTAGPQVEYFPRLEGRIEYGITLRIWPSLYVSLLGRRWTLDVFELPVDLPPITDDWLFDPAPALLLLPDVARRERVVDFGEVNVGEVAIDAVPFESIGRVDLRVAVPDAAAGPFSYPRAETTVPPRTTVSLPVHFAPTEAGTFEQRVFFRTNDPDTPTLPVLLRGTGIARETSDAGSDVVLATGDAGDAGEGGVVGTSAGSCNCRAAGSNAPGPGFPLGVMVALALGTLAGRKRRASHVDQ